MVVWESSGLGGGNGGVFCWNGETLNLGGHHESLPSNTHILFSLADHLSVFLSSFFAVCSCVNIGFYYFVSKYILHISLLKHIIHTTMTIFYIPKYKRCWISVVIWFLSHTVWNKLNVNNKNTRTICHYC